MILHLNKETNTYQAVWKKNSVQHVYDCSFSACQNPCCTCNTLDVEMSLVAPESGGYGQTKTVVIDVMTCALGVSDSGSVIHDDLAFSEMFLELLDQDDFDLLMSEYRKFKYQVTETDNISSIGIRFDYHDIEDNGTMITYNDLLPHGKEIRLDMDEENYIVFDQHCVRPKCNCTHVYLEFNRFKALKELEPDFFVLSLDYKTREWAEDHFIEHSPWPLKRIREALETHYPDFYALMSSRQKKLKAIYAQSKQKYAKPRIETPQAKIGRNDPCPCGSGKKFKKCCMT